MIRNLSLATALAVAIAGPAAAEDKKTTEPSGRSGPTDTMTDQVPQMKSDAAREGAGSANSRPPSKAVGEAVPPMHPGDAASGQSDTKSSPNAAAKVAPAGGDSATLTKQQELSLIGKPIYSSDGKEIGEVTSFRRDDGDNVTGLHANVGGFLGLGQSRVQLTPDQFKLQSDRVVLELTAEQAKELPKAQD